MAERRADLRVELAKGVRACARLVGATLGPLGGAVVIGRDGRDHYATHDGVTVARNVRLRKPLHDTGARMVLAAANRVAKEAGDGTTQTALLAWGMVKAGLRGLAVGVAPTAIREGLAAGAEAARQALAGAARPATPRLLRAVARQASAGDSRLADRVTAAVAAAGPAGVVTIGHTDTMTDRVTVRAGYGWMAPVWEGAGRHFPDALVWLCGDWIAAEDLAPTGPFLEAVGDTGRPLVIVCPGIERKALACLAAGYHRGLLKGLAVCAWPGVLPLARSRLDDLAALTGATVREAVACRDLGTTTLADCGTADMHCDWGRLAIALPADAPAQARIAARVRALQAQAEAAPHVHAATRLRIRAAQLGGALVEVACGGVTEAVRAARVRQAEDVLMALRGAVAEGCVLGGGAALVRAAAAVRALLPRLTRDQRIGALAVAEGLAFPARQLGRTAHLEGLAQELAERPPTQVYDVVADAWVDGWDAGLVDAAPVARWAVTCAADVAASLLTCHVVIVQQRVREVCPA